MRGTSPVHRSSVLRGQESIFGSHSDPENKLVEHQSRARRFTRREVYPFYREWLPKTCERAGFTPKVLQDVDLERTMIHAVAAGLGVALVPEQVKKFEHENVVFRPLNPTVRTEGCVAWKDNNPSAALKAYVQIVEQVGRSIR